MRSIVITAELYLFMNVIYIGHHIKYFLYLILGISNIRLRLLTLYRLYGNIN